MTRPATQHHGKTGEETVVWLDDDSPRVEELAVGGMKVIPAQSCKKAWTIVERERSAGSLGCVVVDPIVPQEGWGTMYLEVPGVDFVKAIRELVGVSIPVIIYGASISTRRRDAAIDAGATAVYAKNEMSLAEVVASVEGLRGITKSGDVVKGEG